MGTNLSSRINVVLVSRLVGQDGFTSSEIYLSYLDANYVGSDMSILLHHEFVHYYDCVLGGVYFHPYSRKGWLYI
jgi:hypothetical protein